MITLRMFTAPWCSQCPAMKRRVLELKEINSNVCVEFFDLSNAEDAMAASDFAVSAVPTTFVMSHGRVQAIFTGIAAKTQLQLAINRATEADA